MDELSLFFSVPSSDLCTNQPFRTRSNYHSSCNLKNIEIDNLELRRNSSVPIFSGADTFGLSPPDANFSANYSGSPKLPPSLPPEIEAGNIEYKLKLVNPSQNRFEHLITQMKWRLNEGRGQAIYRLGVDDNGAVTGLTASEMAASLLTISRMSRLLGTSLTFLRERTINNEISSTPSPNVLDFPGEYCLMRKAVELLVKRNLPVNRGLPDLYITVLGSVDVGKSTLLGILTYGELDNGRGRARLNLFRHLHEVQSGRTSSLSSEVIGFDVAGRLVNRKRSKGRINRRTVDEVVRDSHRLVTLIDLAGHPRYQRTTLYGLARSHPSFAVLVVSATGGPTPEGLDHARTVAALGLRLAVVVSKIDLLQHEDGEVDDDIENTVTVKTAVQSDLKSNVHLFHKSSSMATIVKPQNRSTRSSTAEAIAEIKSGIQNKLKEIVTYYRDENCQIQSKRCFEKDLPIFALSNVNGYGLNELLVFLAHISSVDAVLADPEDTQFSSASSSSSNCVKLPSIDTNVEFWITKVFWHVPGASNPVLEGVLKKGKLHDNQDLWLGPCNNGDFIPVRISEIHRNRQPHFALLCGQTGSIVLIHSNSVVNSTPVGNNGGDPNSEEITSAQHHHPLQVRRGMVLINRLHSRVPVNPSEKPVSLGATQISSPNITAVCWSIVVSDITWVPCSNGWSKNCRCYPSTNSSVAVFSGNVLQQARVVETTITSNLVAAYTHLVKNVDTSLLRLDPASKVVLRFLRQPEYLDRGRLLILSFDSGAKAIGRISELLDVVTIFSDIETKMSADVNLRNETQIGWPPSELHRTPPKPVLVETEPSSLEELLRRLGINQNGSYCYEILPHEALFPDNIKSLTFPTQFCREDLRNCKRLNRVRALANQNCAVESKKDQAKSRPTLSESEQEFTVSPSISSFLDKTYTTDPRQSTLPDNSSNIQATPQSSYMRYVTYKLEGCRRYPFETKLDTFVEQPQTVTVSADQMKESAPESNTVKRMRKRRRRRRRHRN